MDWRENIVKPFLVKLEVLVTWAGEEPRYVSARVAAETGRGTRLGAGPTAELAPLFKKAHRIPVFSHIIGGYQALMSSSNNHHIETCVSHWYLLFCSAATFVATNHLLGAETAPLHFSYGT
jgi:hypothetical protein